MLVFSIGLTVAAFLIHESEDAARWAVEQGAVPRRAAVALNLVALSGVVLTLVMAGSACSSVYCIRNLELL